VIGSGIGFIHLEKYLAESLNKLDFRKKSLMLFVAVINPFILKTLPTAQPTNYVLDGLSSLDIYCILLKKKMSVDQMNNSDETQHRIMKYFLDELNAYAHKSHIWQLLHASHIHRNLLKKSRHFSKIHSISEDLVQQCISQLLSDVDQYVAQLYQLVSSQQFDGMISAFNHSDKINSGWHKMQLERARQLFPIPDNSNQQFSDNDVLENYYKYVQNKFTPKKDASHTDRMVKLSENPFDLNMAYSHAETKAKEFLKNFFTKTRERQTPNLKLVDEMIKLGTRRNYFN
jgi:hypothetical protein